MLFNDSINITIEDGDVSYYPEVFDKKQADLYFKILLKQLVWQQDCITLFGKTHLQPRLTALYGNNNKAYSYSNIKMYPKPFSETLLEIKNKVDKISHVNFTTCLANLYRTGNDSNGWHSDNEKELGNQPIIASLSFGEERYFNLKHKTKKTLKHKIKLQHGSLLLMKGSTQEHWLHQIPKTKKEIGKRINLTFRVIV